MSQEDHIDNDFKVLRTSLKDKIFQINNRSKPGLTHFYCYLMIFEYFLSCVSNYSCGSIVSRTLNITCFMNKSFQMNQQPFHHHQAWAELSATFSIFIPTTSSSVLSSSAFSTFNFCQNKQETVTTDIVNNP